MFEGGGDMKCRHCGAEIIRIGTMGGIAACDAAPITYWPPRGDDGDRELITPNGIRFYGRVIPGDIQDAVGIAHAPHTCQLLLVHLGRDSWDRPVYRCLTNGRLYVDTDPRKGREPHICTKCWDDFEGEPCDPVDADFTFVFVPQRDTW